MGQFQRSQIEIIVLCHAGVKHRVHEIKMRLIPFSLSCYRSTCGQPEDHGPCQMFRLHDSPRRSAQGFDIGRPAESSLRVGYESSRRIWSAISSAQIPIGAPGSSCKRMPARNGSSAGPALVHITSPVNFSDGGSASSTMLIHSVTTAPSGIALSEITSSPLIEACRAVP